MAGIMAVSPVRVPGTVFPQRLPTVIYGKVPRKLLFSEKNNWVLWSGLEKDSTSIDISSLDIPAAKIAGKEGKSLMSAVTYYQMANPEKYWYASGSRAKVSYDDTVSNPHLTFLYPHAEHLNDAAFEKKVSEICKKARKKKTSAGRIKSVNASIIRNTRYIDTDTFSHAYDAYGALVEKKAVCYGYAEAFYLCMKRLHIPVKYEFNKSCTHVWNRVKVGKKWKVVDVTWNETTHNGYLLSSSHKGKGVYLEV